MSIEVGSAYLTILPSSKNFAKNLQGQVGGDAEKVGKSSGKRMGGAMAAGVGGATARMFAPVAAGIAAIGIGGFFKGAISSASDLSESGSKVGVVFGKSAAQIVAASKTSATSMGLTEGAYLAANGTLGNLMVSLGIAPAKAAGMSQEMVKLAGDMASFNNVPVADALAAIQSGLTGETEPLKAFGVNMSDATLKAQALKMGLIKSTKEAMNPQTKALAAQALIMAQTGTAQGDFARTSGGLANQQKILGAQFDNLKTKIGGALLPVMTRLVTFLNTSIGPAFAAVKSFIAPVVTAIKGFFDSGSQGPSKFAPLVAFFQTKLVPAFAGIVASVRKFVDVALPIVAAFVAGMMTRIRPMLPTIRTIFRQVGEVIVSVMGLIQAVISRVTAVISYIWTRWGGSIMSFITGVWSKIFTIINAALGVIRGVIKTVTSLIKGDWSGAWTGIRLILSSAWTLIKGIISGALRVIGGIISGAWALIKLGASAAWDGIKTLIVRAFVALNTAAATKFGELVKFVKGVPGRIVTALGNVKTLLAAKGAEILQGFWDGMTGVWKKITGWVSSIATWIKDHKGPLSLDRKLLTPAGRGIMEGFHDGLKSGFATVQSSVSGMAGQIGSGVARWLPLVQIALGRLGQPLSLAPIVLRRMNQESGGDPNVVNRWDSNWLAGIPSKGLLQTIDPTFQAYRDRSLPNNVFDPFANIVASMRYTLATYGSLAAGYNRAGGYAAGTNNAAPGYAWVGERGPELLKFRGGESVTPNHALGGTTVNINGNVGWSADEVANRIAVKQRDAASMYNLVGV